MHPSSDCLSDRMEYIFQLNKFEDGETIIDMTENDYKITEIYKPVPNHAGKDFIGDIKPAV